jgi:phosphatidylglycerol:prolipoprotein diacylglycerol transferase
MAQAGGAAASWGFPLPPPVHGVFVLLGTAAAVALLVREARRRLRLDHELMIVVVGALGCGALAAKLSTLWPYLQTAAEPSLGGILVNGGKSVLGGLAGAYLGVLVTKRLIGYRDATGDLFAPAVALGIGIGRIGCLLTETPGTPTGSSWGIVLDAGQAARLPGFPPGWVGVPLHPSFAYEIAFHAAALAALLRLRSRPELSGELFKLYLLAYALLRFAVEFVRGNQVVWLGLTRSQLFLVPSALVLAAALWRSLRVRAVPGGDRALEAIADA